MIKLPLFCLVLAATTTALTYDNSKDQSEYSGVSDGYAANQPQAWWRIAETKKKGTEPDVMGVQHGTYDMPAGRFNGKRGHIDIGTVKLTTGEMTILAWFRAEDFKKHDARIISMSQGEDVQSHFWMLSTVEENKKMHLRYRLRTKGSTTELVGKKGNFKASERIFAACVYDGKKMRIFQNGKLVGETKKSGKIDTNEHVHTWIGDNPSDAGSRPFNGDIDNVAIFDHAISENAIKAIWQSANQGDEKKANNKQKKQNEKLKAIQNAKKELEKQLAESKKQQAEAMEIAEEVKRKAEEAAKGMEKLKLQNEKLAKSVDEKTKRAAEMTAQQKKLAAENEKAKKQAEDLATEKEAALAEIAKAEELASERKKRFRNQQSKLKKGRAELQKQLEAANAKAKATQEKLSSEIADLSKKLEQLAKKRKQAEAQVAKAQAENDELKSASEEQKAAAKKELQVANAALKAANAEAESTQKSLAATTTSLGEAIAKQQEQREFMENARYFDPSDAPQSIAPGLDTPLAPKDGSIELTQPSNDPELAPATDNGEAVVGGNAANQNVQAIGNNHSLGNMVDDADDWIDVPALPNWIEMPEPVAAPMTIQSTSPSIHNAPRRRHSLKCRKR